MRKTLITAISIAAAAALPASAGGWEALSVNEAGQPARITAASANGLNAALVCSTKGKLTAALSTKPVDMARVLSSQSAVSRVRTSNLTIGESEPHRTPMVYWSSRSLLITRTHKAGAKVFNGVVRGEPIEVKLSGDAAINYELPKADAVFAKFASACSAQKKSK